MVKRISKMLAFLASSGILLGLGQGVLSDYAQTSGNITLVERLSSPTTPFVIIGLVIILGILFWFIFLRHDDTEDIPKIKADVQSIKSDMDKIKDKLGIKEG